MRRLLGFFLLFALPVAARAESGVEIRIDPPAPTSRNAITATISGLWGDGCPPQEPVVSVSGGTIRISFSVSHHPCPILPIVPVTWQETAFIGVLQPGVYQLEAVVPSTSIGTFASRRVVVRDATDLLTVVPSVIFSLPGTVRLRSAGIGTCAPNGSPCLPPQLTVTFDGIASSEVRIESASEITASIPAMAEPPPAGHAFTVVISTDDGRRVESKTALFLADPDGEYDPALFERVMVPVIVSGPGALGSHWTTDVFVTNPGADEVPLFRTPLEAFGCGLPEGCRISGVIPPQFSGTITGQWPTGLFIHVGRGSAVRFQVLARDLSQQASALGTEIPVVRETDWRDNAIHILNVPSDSRFRVALRVYLEGDVGVFSSVPLRIFRMNGEAPLIETSLPLDVSHIGQIPATNWIADLGPHFAIPAGEPLRVEIGRPATGHRFWAFASVTNNATQHVTVISPQ